MTTSSSQRAERSWASAERGADDDLLAQEALEPAATRHNASGSTTDRPVADSTVADRPVADRTVADRALADSSVAGSTVADGTVTHTGVADGAVANPADVVATRTSRDADLDNDSSSAHSGSTVADTGHVADSLGPVRVGEYAATSGMPARGVVLASLLVGGACAGLDLVLTGRITVFFDLCFVVVCLVSAMAVRRGDLFTAGVLPPLLFAAIVAFVAVRSPGTFVAVGGVTKAFMTGLSEHAVALVAGYGLALVTVGGRVAAARAP